MDAIVAVYSDWGIGARGTQPVVLKADRLRFRTETSGAAVIVGRKTMEDFPGTAAEEPAQYRGDPARYGDRRGRCCTRKRRRCAKRQNMSAAL